MLGTAEAARKALGVPDIEQRLVVLGRWCSACFAAGGVAAFALLAWRVRGWGGFWVVGLLLMTQHQVFELAHYFKEDTALFFAVALAFLALHVYHRRPGWGAALFAGGACGLCLSAKYLGGVMLIPAVVILAAAGGARWGWFAAAFLAVVAAVNFRCSDTWMCLGIPSGGRRRWSRTGSAATRAGRWRFSSTCTFS